MKINGKKEKRRKAAVSFPSNDTENRNITGVYTYGWVSSFLEYQAKTESDEEDCFLFIPRPPPPRTNRRCLPWLVSMEEITGRTAVRSYAVAKRERCFDATRCITLIQPMNEKT